MASANKQTTNWMFTINNPEETDNPTQWEDVRFLAYQKEKGEEETEHWQGYVVMTKRKTLGGMKRVNGRAHWEPRKGSHKQALAYVTKEDTRIDGPWISGDEPQQGARSDLEAVKADIEKGAKEIELASEHFAAYCRYYKAFNRYMGLLEPKRNDPCTTIVLFGKPGTGKTRRAQALAGEDYFILEQPNSTSGAVWWEHYEGEKTIIIDEFYGWIPRNVMNRICDRYPMTVQNKGGSRQLQATQIIITSNAHPDTWWPRSGLGAMVRRLSGERGHVVRMDGPGVWSPRDGATIEELWAEIELEPREEIHEEAIKKDTNPAPTHLFNGFPV